VASDYRYLLEVRLVAEPALHPRLAVILKNPSTASATRSDPTVGKVEAWARRRGFATVVYVNLFARRATRPGMLRGMPYEAVVGPENDAWVQAAVAWADVTVAAWGNPNGIERTIYDRRIGEVLRLVEPTRPLVVGRPTRLGYPRHGLQWNGEPPVGVWEKVAADTLDRPTGSVG
jgi:hypothetical protein